MFGGKRYTFTKHFSFIASLQQKSAFSGGRFYIFPLGNNPIKRLRINRSGQMLALQSEDITNPIAIITCAKPKTLTQDIDLGNRTAIQECGFGDFQFLTPFYLLVLRKMDISREYGDLAIIDCRNGSEIIRFNPLDCTPDEKTVSELFIAANKQDLPPPNFKENLTFGWRNEANPLIPYVVTMFDAKLSMEGTPQRPLFGLGGPPRAKTNGNSNGLMAALDLSAIEIMDRTGQEVRRIRLSDSRTYSHPKHHAKMALSGPRLAVAFENRVDLWDATQRAAASDSDKPDRPIDSWKLGKNSDIKSIVFDHTGTKVITGGADGRIATWNVE